MKNQKFKDQKKRSMFSKNEIKIFVTKGSSFLNKPFFKKEKMRKVNICRTNNRCVLSYRSRCVFRHFKMSRGILRQKMSFGEIPGVVKASW